MNDAPLAYDELWIKLRARLEREAAYQAVRAATGETDIQVRRAQGAHQMCKTIVALMDQIKDEEQGAAFPDEDESLKH